MDTIGARIKKLRLNKQMTQEELANILGVGKSSISMYENNKITPEDSIKLKLADYFDVTTDYLLGRTNFPKTVRIEGEQIPKELRDIGIEYLSIAKEMANKEIPPEDIKKIIEVLTKRK